jgi:hypothetical protein
MKIPNIYSSSIKHVILMEYDEKVYQLYKVHYLLKYNLIVVNKCI